MEGGLAQFCCCFPVAYNFKKINFFKMFYYAKKVLFYNRKNNKNRLVSFIETFSSIRKYLSFK